MQNERYEDEVAQATANPGVVTGLVVGGSTGQIMFIECTDMAGSGNIKLTGQLGEVLRESASIAMSWVKSKAFALGLVESASSTLVKDRDIHIHLPVGAVQKDGPSAGIGLAVGLVSLFSQRPVNPKIAMTGELSLRGHVLPIGGLKQKVLAAHRAGIETVILPKRNEKDLKDIPQEVKDRVRFVLVSTMWDVLREIWPDYLKEHIGIESRL
jgi:ATP-dependent Lon protease